MKRFTVPCDFGKRKYPFHVYIGTGPAPDCHPLKYQSYWLNSIRGGSIPSEVMDSFGRLLNIAQENGVSFEDLCVYALGTADSPAPEKEVETSSPSATWVKNRASADGTEVLTVDPAESLRRTITVIYGTLDNGSPFWLFAAIKPSAYPAFQEAYRNGTLDVHEFEPYGEILVCGEGKHPPTDVISKVAEMYQTDAATLMGAMVDEPPPNVL